MFFTGSSAYIILFVFTLISPFAYLVFINISKPEFSIDFKLPKSIEKEENTECKFTINNLKRLFFPKIKYNLIIRNPVTKEQSVINFSDFVLPKSSNENKFSFISSFCGTVSFKIEKIRIYDLFGIVYKTVSLNKCVYITVLPEITQTHSTITSSSNTEFYEFETTKRGNDLYNISYLREYQKGDSLKQIHYKLSAKNDNYIVKQGVDNEQKTAQLVFDNFVEKELTPMQSNSKVEEFISICFALIEKNIKLQISTFINNKITSFEINSEDDLFSAVPEILKVEFIVANSVFK